jgi:F-box/WD-40 domain protein MET30
MGHEGDLGRPVNDPKIAKESARGKFLFSASDDFTIRVWDLYTRECVRVLKGHVAQVQSLRVYTADTLEPTVTTPEPFSNLPASKGATERTVYDEFLSTAGGSCDSTQATLPSASSITTPSAFRAGATEPTPDVASLPVLNLANEKKPVVISASLDNTLKVWDVEKGVCEKTMFGHIEGVWDVDVDKLRVVSGSHDRTLKVRLPSLAGLSRK